MPPTNSQKFRRFIHETRKADDEYGSRQKTLDIAFNRWPSYPMIGEQPWAPPSPPSSLPSSPPPSPSPPLPLTFPPGFGVNGVVSTDFEFGGATVNSLAFQLDGKIVAVGESYNSESVKLVTLVRYNYDGSLDTTFGSGGKVTSTLGNYESVAKDIVLKPDGKLLIAGNIYIDDDDFLLACYTPTGILDSGFGTGGYVSTKFDADYSSDYGRAITIQSDGNIVVGGAAGATTSFGLARYTPDGVLDSSFDTDGTVITSFLSQDDEIYDIAIQSDGKIVAAGFSQNSSGANWTALARYNPDGSLDAGFGIDGKTRIIFFGGRDSLAYTVLIQPDGKIVVVGTTDSPGNEVYALARFNGDGVLDTGFGTNGEVKIDFGLSGSRAYGAALQSDGRIIVAGEASMAGDDSGVSAATLARYNIDGSLDTSFGTGGLAQIMLGSNGGSVRSVLVQPDDRIIVGGAASETQNYFGLARFNADGSPDV